MTPDEVIKMAREAGWSYMEAGMQSKMLERFAALVAAHEREACADVCDQHASCEGIAQECAAAIRERGATNGQEAQ